MSVYQMTHDELLTLGRRVVANSRTDAAVANAMASYGYNADAFDNAEALINRFADAMQTQQEEKGHQVSATEALRTARDAFHRGTYLPHVQIARIVFSDAGTLRRLGAGGRRPDAFDAYLQSARRFYTSLQHEPTLLQAIGERGVSVDDVEAALEAVDELEALDQTQEHLKSRAQQSTRDRNAARTPVERWLADYLKLARLALADEPDRLEQLGITVAS